MAPRQQQRSKPPDHRTADRRKIAVRRVLGGEQQVDVARDLGVSKESVRKWMRWYEAGGWKALGGSDAPRGRSPAVPDVLAAKLIHRAVGAGATSLADVVDLARAMGMKASRSAIRRALITAGYWPG